jgi:D-amino-acid dehydrogenase
VGERLPIYPVKGYSITLPTDASCLAPTVSITDEERKLVFSRLGNRLRVAGTAELTGYDSSLNASRCEAILNRTLEIFPRAGNRSQVEYWAGLRPATPGNVPLIGRTRYRNLFLNTGHGTLGWTLSWGSAAALADIVSGRNPEISFPFCGGIA